MGGGCNVVLLQQLPVYFHSSGIVVDGDGVAAFGDDPLDQRFAVGSIAVHDHHVPALGRVARAPDDQLVPIDQRGHHGAAVHLNDAEEKRKDQHQHQRCRDQCLVPFQQVLPTHGLCLFLFFHIRYTSPSGFTLLTRLYRSRQALRKNGACKKPHFFRNFDKEKRDNKVVPFLPFQIGDDQISLLTLAALPVRPRR